MNKSKQKGTAWETEIVKTLQSSGFSARRKTLSGSADKGDIEIVSIPDLVIEAKNSKIYKLAEWVAEAKIEAENANADFGVVWMHRDRKSSPLDGYVVMDGDTFIRLLAILEGVK